MNFYFFFELVLIFVMRKLNCCLLLWVLMVICLVSVWVGVDVMIRFMDLSRFVMYLCVMVFVEIKSV